MRPRELGGGVPRRDPRRSAGIFDHRPRMTESARPALRAVETIIVPDPQHGRVLVLRDTEGVAEGSVSIPPPLIPIVARFTGEKTCTQIARDLSAEVGAEVDVDVIVR